MWGKICHFKRAAFLSGLFILEQDLIPPKSAGVAPSPYTVSTQVCQHPLPHWSGDWGQLKAALCDEQLQVTLCSHLSFLPHQSFLPARTPPSVTRPYSLPMTVTQETSCFSVLENLMYLRHGARTCAQNPSVPGI